MRRFSSLLSRKTHLNTFFSRKSYGNTSCYGGLKAHKLSLEPLEQRTLLSAASISASAQCDYLAAGRDNPYSESLASLASEQGTLLAADVVDDSLFADVSDPVHQERSLAATGNDVCLYYLDNCPIWEPMVRSVVAYVDKDGAAVDWMMDGLILFSKDLLFYADNPTQTSCEFYIDQLFDGGQVELLDDIVGDLKVELNDASHKLSVFLSVPVPEDDMADSSQTIANCQTLLDAWNSLDPANLELAGFYWGYSESFPSGYNWDDICADVGDSDPLDGLDLLWIPYLNGDNFSSWQSYNIDYATQQPNYAFNTQNPAHFATVNNRIVGSPYLTGAELEFGPTRNSGLSSVQNAGDYILAAGNYEWNQNEITTYYHAQPIYGYSTGDTQARTIYERLYRFVSPSVRAQWSFTDGAANDSSCGDNDGTIYGAISTGNTGGISGALNFDGTDDYVEIPDNSDLDITSAITLEAWVKPESFPNNLSQIVGRSAYGQRMLLRRSGGVTTVLVQMGTNHETPAVNITADGEWYHIVYTSDGTTSYIYVDGVQVGSAGSGGANFSSSAPIRIGKTIGSYYPFDGCIDEVNIYSRVLTAEEVATAYEEGLNQIDLRGNWSFDEGYGSAAHDSIKTLSACNSPIYGAAWTNDSVGSGSALHFDGIDDCVERADSNYLDITSAITLEAWVKPESFPNNLSQIVGRSAYGQRMLLRRSGGVTTVLVQMGTNHETPAVNITADGEWYHIVYTSDGTTSYIYVDGVQVGSAGSGGANFSSSAPVRIGKTIGNYYPFDGCIDEVNIFGRVLSADEVLSRYNEGIVDCGVELTDTFERGADDSIDLGVTEDDNAFAWGRRYLGTVADDAPGIATYIDLSNNQSRGLLWTNQSAYTTVYPGGMPPAYNFTAEFDYVRLGTGATSHGNIFDFRMGGPGMLVSSGGYSSDQQGISFVIYTSNYSTGELAMRFLTDDFDNDNNYDTSGWATFIAGNPGTGNSGARIRIVADGLTLEAWAQHNTTDVWTKVLDWNLSGTATAEAAASAGYFTFYTSYLRDLGFDNIMISSFDSTPTAKAGGLYSVEEGSSVTLSADSSSDLDGSIVSYDWDLNNDGQYDCSGVTVDYLADAYGLYTVALRVTDNDGVWSFDTAQINVLAANPYPGDANRDGTVNGTDAIFFAQNWLYGRGMDAPDATWSMGDFNDDGCVDDIDSALMAAYWGRTLPRPTASTAAILSESAAMGPDDADANIKPADLHVVPDDANGVEVEIKAARYDLDHSGRVDLGDLASFALVYGEKPSITTENPYAFDSDFDGSGKVDLGDLAIFAVQCHCENAVVKDDAAAALAAQERAAVAADMVLGEDVEQGDPLLDFTISSNVVVAAIKETDAPIGDEYGPQIEKRACTANNIPGRKNSHGNARISVNV